MAAQRTDKKPRRAPMPYVIVEPTQPRYPTVEAAMLAAVPVLVALLNKAAS